MSDLYKSIKKIAPPFLLSSAEDLRTYASFQKHKKKLHPNIELKSVHTGKRCFILGSGPSIKTQDLKFLKNEIVITLNNLFVIPDFEYFMSSNNIPKYHMTPALHPPQTKQEWTDWFTDMQQSMPLNVTMLLGLSKYKPSIFDILTENKLFEAQKIYWYFCGLNFDKEKKYNDSLIDITKPIWGAKAGSIYALTMALYMGFDEIFLMGLDHDYFLHNSEKDMRVYSKAKHQNNELQRTFGDRFYIEEFARQSEIFSQYYTLHGNTGSKVYNVSPNSLLKVFPYADYNEIINS